MHNTTLSTKNETVPLQYQLNEVLTIQRLPKHLQRYYEIKDPSIVALPNQTYMMFASVGNSIEQHWKVGRFMSTNPEGPWHELSPVIFQNLAGPQLCAPAVTYEEVNGRPLWKMYIQTACFEEDGVIALATSEDGHIFYGETPALATRQHIKSSPAPVVGVYDVAVSEVRKGNEELLCMLYSGYRRVGCGDLYASYRRKSDPESSWSDAECVLAQEQVPFHNHPNYEFYEWGLEGAKLIQLSESCFLLIGVCFQPKPVGFEGTRQRVFFAVSDSMNGPFQPLCMPFMPQSAEGKGGENGHPDTMIVGDELWVIYQERTGGGQPWHLRIAKYHLPELRTALEQAQTQQLGQYYQGDNYPFKTTPFRNESSAQAQHPTLYA